MIIEINDDFDLKKIINSGQCFRAKQIKEDSFRFITGDEVLTIRELGQGRYSVSCNPKTWNEIWVAYFDLRRDYRALRSLHYGKNPFIDEAISYAQGIRVLQQNPWETLISFIISQRKSIPAITKSVEMLCAKYGHTIDGQSESSFSFPTAHEMSSASEMGLLSCGLGYRVRYVIDAVRKVRTHQIQLDALSDMTDQELIASLETIYGVGKKVANCVALFAYGRTTCVPIDVWIARAIREECYGINPFEAYNEDAGIIQQYVFFYEKRRQRYAISRLNDLPLCNRLLRETHKQLMRGVRGEDKNPGEFRRSQNWIGPHGCALKDARFVPPNVIDMIEAMSDLEKYINGDSDLDVLVRAALIHYQFETIHPFLDGNGRIGRLLILLYLMEQGLLEKPILYVSYFLKKNQIEYYDRISEVRRSGNYEQWIRFFLEAVCAASMDALESIYELTKLHDKNLALLPSSRRVKDHVRRLFNYVEQHPIIDIKKTAEALDISFNTAASAVRKLTDLNILCETTNGARNRVFAYQAYLDILRKGT